MAEVEDRDAGATGDDVATRRATTGFGALMVVAGIVVVADALALPETTGVVGPAAVPLPVGVLLVVVGGLLATTALRGAGGPRALLPAPGAASSPGPGARRVAVLVVALVAFTVLLPLLGWTLSAAALFVAAALALGAPRRPVIAAYGWVLAAAVFLVFDRLIGLTLPAGPWGF